MPAPFGQRYEITRGDPALAAGSNYGECVTASDPDPTDLGFSDATQPAPGKALSYLISAGNLVCHQTGTLGHSSSGATRSNTNPAACPH